MRKIVKSNKGFSLIEVLSSLTVFAVAAAGLAGTTMATIKTNSVSRSTTAASALVQDKVEELRSMDPLSNPPDFAAGYHSDSLNPMSATGEAQGGYTRTWKVSRDTPAIGLAEVVITVGWTGADGDNAISAATFVCLTDLCA